MEPRRFFLAAVVVFGLIISLHAAYAYPTGPGGIPLPQPPADTSGSFNISLGDSWQTLIAPFVNFFNSLKNSIGTQPVVGPEINPMPSGIPSFNFGNGSPSDIVKTILNGILWVLSLAQQLIQWVLGFVH